MLCFGNWSCGRLVFSTAEDGLRDKAMSEKVSWDIWAEQGYLTTISGPVIQPEVIALAVVEVSEEYDFQLFAYDRWHVADFKRELDNIGAQIPMQPFGQGFKDMAPAVDKLEQLVAERKLRHGGNPILNMCAAGAVIQSDPAGNRKLNKAKSYSKIDGLVALSMALGSMSADEVVSATSPWDDPEFKLAV